MIPPNSPDMETAVLGSMLLTVGAVEVGLDFLTAEDFYDPANAITFTAIARLYHAGKPIEPALVAQIANQDPQGIRLLAAQAPAAISIRAYVDVVAEKAALRRTIGYAERLASAAWAGDIETCDALLLNPMGMVLDARDDGTEPVEASQLAEQAGEVEWLVKGLLARLETVVWVGEPGYGKSTLLRQMAVCVASGMHPFTRNPIAPLRVLIVDCQESAPAAGAAIRPLLRLAGARYQGTLWVDSVPQGIDLSSTRWQRWLDRRVGMVKPDLVILGPLYNAVRGAAGRSKQSEETAELAATALGDLLVKHGCALMIEAHAPHGQEMRVRGSKLWEDWPAFGFGLVDDKDQGSKARAVRIEKFRGDRFDGRAWPKRFVQGVEWPWEAV